MTPIGKRGHVADDVRRRDGAFERLGTGPYRRQYHRSSGDVALISPSVGRKAQTWWRRPLLTLAFAALALRGSFFSVTRDPSMLVVIQIFDGITAAVFGVMVPLIVADITYGSGHFNLAQGIVGTATGIGASLSPALAGFASDHFGHDVAFVGLASVALVGLFTIWAIMPETKTSLSREPA